MMERVMLVSRVEILESKQGSGTSNGSGSSGYPSEANILERLFVIETNIENINNKLKGTSTERQHGEHFYSALETAWRIHKQGLVVTNENIQNRINDNNKRFNQLTIEAEKRIGVVEFKVESLINQTIDKVAKQLKEVEDRIEVIHVGLNKTFKDYTTQMEKEITRFINQTDRTLNGIRAEITSDECASDPCKNGATCVDGIQSYTCLCLAGYSGSQCQIGSLGTTQCMNDTNVIEGDSRTCGEVFGNESTCVQGKCACSDGYVPNLTNTACEQGFLGTTQCADYTNAIKGDSRTCGEVFGSESTCVQGKCACSDVYVPKYNNTVCEKGSLGTTQCVDTCNTNVIKGDSRTCRDVFGSESACVHGKCACSDGYVPNPTNTFCEQGYLGRTYCEAHNYLVRRYIRTCEQVFGTGTTCVHGKCVCSAPSYVPSLTITACVRVNEAYGRTPISTLSVTNGNTFGDWGNAAYCPPGTFATGYIMKIEPYQGSTDKGPEMDDTSLNAIRLVCTDLGGVVRGQISSLEGPWGDWTPEEPCPKGSYLVSFNLQVESFQGGKLGEDDTSANYVKFLCRDFAGEKGQTELVRSPGHGFWGVWGGWSQTCVPNSAICGLKTRVERYLREGDDTTLNDVIFYCCNQLY